jgi:TorA maturation chaperone TorD
LDKKIRAFVYAFLSRAFERALGSKEIEDLQKNPELLEMIGNGSKEYFKKDIKSIEEELNIDFNSLFVVNSQPIETLIVDSTGEILVGLQNPVMFFYFEHGYEVNMNNTEILAPDHLSIEFGFMQNLVYKDDDKVAFNFLKKHLLQWVPPYLVAMKKVAQTPFYKDLCDFTNDFLFSEYENLKEKYDEFRV